MKSLIFAKTACVIINGQKAVIHEPAFKKAAIFSPLIDCEGEGSDPPRPLEITLTPSKYTEAILDLLYHDKETSFLEKIDNASDALEVVGLMTQMGFEESILKSCVSRMTNENILKTIKDLEVLDNSLRVFIENTALTLTDLEIKELATDLQSKTSFISSSVKIIVKLLCAEESRENYDFVTTIYGSKFITSDRRIISDLFSRLQNYDGKDIGRRKFVDTLYSRYLDTKKHVLVHSTNTDILVITEIKIDDKPIPLYDHIKTSTPGTAGGNTMLSYAMFIAKELLGLDPYVDYE